MKLTHLKISNYLGARSVDVRLDNPVTLFCGANGAGNWAEVRRPTPGESGHAGEPASRSGGAANVLDWPSEPDVGRVVDGVPDRLDRLRCLGNAQVPRVAAAAWRILTHAIAQWREHSERPAGAEG